MAIELTTEQAAALNAITAFLRDDSLDAFVLRGSAGTGKTTLVASLVTELEKMHLSCALLAPTGRAARILGNKIQTITGNPQYRAQTIHSAIYVLSVIEVIEGAESANDPGLRMIFPLKESEASVSLFVIDESSMVGDRENRGDVVQFGSGRLLKDVVTYARSSRDGRVRGNLTKLLFIGDPAQLPPVGENASPALSPEYLAQEYKLKVGSFDLTMVMRHAKGSAILDRATELRDAIAVARFNDFSLRPYSEEIEKVDAETAVEFIVQGINSKDSNVAVVYSNAMALEYNRSIRERRWGDADLPIQVGDILLINKNAFSYNLANGDIVRVAQVGEARRVPVSLRGGHHVELRFREVTVIYRDANGSIIQTACLALENLLDSPDRELTPLEVRALLVDFRKRHPDLHPKSDAFRLAIRNDLYFQALQVKYGYAMTCHKAQGGEWNTVVVDFGGGPGNRNQSFFRWAYTAITRATSKLRAVNPPDFTATSTLTWPPSSTPRVAAIKPETEDVSADPDWIRLSFSAATAPLMPLHQRLRAVWASQGIVVEQLQHLQFCERYTLERSGKRTRVQYYYDKKFQMSRSGVVPGAATDESLTDDALKDIQSLEGRQRSNSAQPEEFIQEFLSRLDEALKHSTIQRTGYRSMPYRLRVCFSDGTSKGEIDFTYDGNATWTAAQEVGGASGSHGLYDAVQALMHSGKDAVE